MGPWTRARPQYLRIDKVGPGSSYWLSDLPPEQELSVEEDYSLQYNIALDQSRNRTRG